MGQIGSWRLDVSTDVLTWSDENYRIFELPVGAALTYETFLSLVHPDDREFVDHQWTAGLQGKPYDIEHRLLVDGRVKWVREKAFLEHDEEGNLLGGLGITQDVTSRKVTEDTLRESEERFRTLANDSPFIIWLHDADGELIFVNQTYLEFFAVEMTEVLGGGWQPLVHPEDREQYVDAFASAMRERKAFHSEARVRNAKGEWRWVDSHGSPRFSSSGQFLGMVGSSPDVTERRAAEEELLRAEGAKRAEEERLRLAHDLHDSVTQSLFAATLKAEALAEATDLAQAHLLAAEVRRLDRGALAQMRTMLLELRGDPVEAVSMPRLLTNLVEAAEGSASVKVRLSIDGECTLPPEVHQAAYRITQEALNNVIRHANAHNARVELKVGPSQARLRIEDDGRGFDTACVDGSHFGLKSMKGRTDQSGGRFTVRSAEGGGTVITVEWRFGEPCAGASAGG